jgi:penicillin amidase
VIVKYLIETDQKSLSEKGARSIEIMKKWQGTNNLKDVAPTIYNKWIYFS